jgi:hypothetical protein
MKRAEQPQTDPQTAPPAPGSAFDESSPSTALRWGRVRGFDDPVGYLYRTGMNLFRNRRRRVALAVRRAVRMAPPPSDEMRAVDDRVAIVRALGRLTPARRAARRCGRPPGRQARGGRDPVGREADVVIFGNWGGELIERLYVDPASHDLLAITWTSEVSDQPFQYFVVERAGVTGTRSQAPTDAESIPLPISPMPKAVAETESPASGSG